MLDNTWILVTAKTIVQRKLSHFTPIGNPCPVQLNVLSHGNCKYFWS